jgi:MoaA/NifB/PqqE/SkfB family radical SAM enzyme
MFSYLGDIWKRKEGLSSGWEKFKFVSRPSTFWFITRIITGTIDTRLKSGESLPPYLVSLQPTLRCDMRCEMCLQYGAQGYLNDRSQKRAELPLDDWLNFIDEFSKFKPFVHIWGGEPLLYKYIDEIIYKLVSLKIPMMFTTNAFKGPQHIEALMKVDILRLSLDGPKEVHDSLRKRKGSFERLKGTALEIIKEKKRKKTIFPLIYINMMIVKETYKYLEELFDLTSEWGIDRFVVALPMFTTKKRAKAYQDTFLKEFGINARAQEGFIIKDLEINIKEVMETLYRLKSKSQSPSLFLSPVNKILEIPSYYQDPDDTFGREKCYAPWYQVNALPDGDLVFCDDLPDYIFGNFTKEPFLKAWNSKRATKFRIYLQKRLFSVCSRCYALFCHPVSLLAQRLS